MLAKKFREKREFRKGTPWRGRRCFRSRLIDEQLGKGWWVPLEMAEREKGLYGGTREREIEREAIKEKNEAAENKEN